MHKVFVKLIIKWNLKRGKLKFLNFNIIKQNKSKRKINVKLEFLLIKSNIKNNMIVELNITNVTKDVQTVESFVLNLMVMKANIPMKFTEIKNFVFILTLNKFLIEKFLIKII